jgi:hypothetical protein
MSRRDRIAGRPLGSRLEEEARAHRKRRASGSTMNANDLATSEVVGSNMSTLVDLTRQLSDLRLDVQRLVDTTSVARASEPHPDDRKAKPAGGARQSATGARASHWLLDDDLRAEILFDRDGLAFDCPGNARRLR